MATGDKRTAGDKGASRSSRFFSYFERRKTREGVPTPHVMEELSAHRADRPSWTRSLGPLLFTAVMVALGCGCVAVGEYVVAAVFVVCGLVPSVAVSVMAWRALPAVLGPQRRAGEEELGPYLGAGGDERVRQMSPGLMGQERDVMEWNRAEAAQQWPADSTLTSSARPSAAASSSAAMWGGTTLSSSPWTSSTGAFARAMASTGRASARS